MTRLVSAPLVVLLGLGLSLSPAAAQDHQRAPVPGTVDAHVTQATIHATICQRRLHGPGASTAEGHGYHQAPAC